MKFDVAIIGGGIIGLATAYNILKKSPDTKLLLLEKEKELCSHQSGRNSGVIHSGIYYKPGSLKAKLCRAGRESLESFCEEKDIAIDLCSKVIVATSEEELPRLEKLYQRGQENQVNCELIEAPQLAEIEPHCSGLRAILVRDAGIVDYPAVCCELAGEIQSAGGEIRCESKVVSIEKQQNGFLICSSNKEFQVEKIINCAGLYSDAVTKLSGQIPQAKIIPFRGEYFKLSESAKGLCKNLIYPVPDPAFPFLGVHFTRMTNGDVECGPNAVLAFAKEGYTKLDINPAELASTLTYPGFWKLVSKHTATGMAEMWRSLSKKAFLKALQRLIPEVREQDLISAPAGVRAQALLPNGDLVDDFLIQNNDSITNVINAPSPAATSSLAIGEHVSQCS